MIYLRKHPVMISTGPGLKDAAVHKILSAPGQLVQNQQFVPSCFAVQEVVF